MKKEAVLSNVLKIEIQLNPSMRIFPGSFGYITATCAAKSILKAIESIIVMKMVISIAIYK